MAVLTTAQRKKISPGKFGVYRNGKGSYPMPDRAHAANAKARATQQVDKGNLSAEDAAKIRAKANKILGEKK